MKKVLKYFSLMIAFLLVLTGCNFSKKDGKEEISNGFDKTSKATNFSEKVSVDFSMESEGKKVAANATIDGKVYTEGEQTLMDASIKVGASGMTLEGKLYVDASKDAVKIYINYMGQWLKLDSAALGIDLKEVMSQNTTQQLTGKDLIDLSKEVKSVKSDKKGENKYNVVLDKEKMNKKFTEAYEKAMEEAKKDATSADAISEYEEAINEFKNGIFSKDFSFVMYTKDGYVTGVEIDMASIIDNIAGSLNDAEALAQIKKMNLTGTIKVELSDFGKVSKIEIPAEAINATDATAMLGSM